MFLSIIVPVYNVEKYVDKCLESLTDQDIDDYEILVVNDASTDFSLDRIKYWEQKNNKIKVIDKPLNSGLSDTRNVGIKNASGEYIMFIDSDDYIDNDSLKKFKDIVIMHSPDIIYFGSINEFDNKTSTIQYMYKSPHNKLYEAREFMLYELMHRNLSIPACFAMYKKSLLVDNNLWFDVGLLHEDVRWSPQILYKANRVYTLGYPIYHYLIRTGSISHSKKRKKHGTDQMETCKFLIKYADQIDEKKIREYMKNYVAMTYMKAIATCELVKYKDVIIDRVFPLKHTITVVDSIKAIIFFLSPQWYSYIYGLLKKK